ncbi:tetratricopeptide repeat protein [Qipengyuania sp. DSG2-2]|uniref:tetratricopeptide repeat protein n=1 Tax=Qipengyuania sp. DGS2-2 TaxID=3349631 RepID=UPI0036D21942
MTGNRAFALRLLGTFRLDAPDGSRIDIRSKRSQALLAMLVLGRGGERARAWLQNMLWADRAPEQAQASLRRELSNLRQLVNGDGELVLADNQNVRLNLSLLQCDLDDGAGGPQGELLEGLDIPGATAFDDWLRDERQALANRPYPSSPALAENGAGEAPGTVASELAIAVLRFTASPADEQAEAVAEGLAEDLIDTLAQTRWLPVISRSSSFAHDSGASDPRSVGAVLGARYLVDGRLRTIGDTAILRIELQDAIAARTLRSDKYEWTEKQDRPRTRQILADIAATLGMRIEEEEQRLSYSKDDSELDVTDLIWRGRWHLNRLTDRDHEQAQALFNQALERDPRSSEARIQALWLQIRDLWRKRSTDEEIRGARHTAQALIQASPDDGRGYMLAAITELWLGHLTRAQQGFERAIERNPSLTMAHAQLGSVHLFKGEWDEAVSSHERARRLSPSDQDLFFIHGELGMIHVLAGRYEEAIDHAERSLALRAGYWYAHMVLAAAHMQLGQENDAREALAALLRNKPDFSRSYVDWLPFEDRKHGDFLLEQLNRAGFAAD